MEVKNADVTSLEEDLTVSSASLLLSPREGPLPPDHPLDASTPLRPRTLNGLTRLDKNSNCEDASIISNENGNLVAESTNSIDVLSAGESDAGDTLRSRKHYNSISSSLPASVREGKRGHSSGDQLHLLARQLLMTERTYKRDLELITVSWSVRVSALAGAGPGAGGDALLALGRACLALEPVALAQGAFLARLDKALASAHAHTDKEEGDYKKVAELINDYLTNAHDAYQEYIEGAGALVARLEQCRRASGEAGGGTGEGAAAAACTQFEQASPLPLAALLLRPLHAVLHYENCLTECVWSALEGGRAGAGAGALGRAALRALGGAARGALAHAEPLAALCQLQRDIHGYDKLLVADREFLRLGCLYKHSNKGLQQRMLFLFTDILIIASKSSNSSQFKAHSVLPLHSLQLESSDMPHTFTLQGDGVTMTLSTRNESEFVGWLTSLELAMREAKNNPTEIDTELTINDNDNGTISVTCDGGGGNNNGGVAQLLSHVAYYRAISLTRELMHVALRTQVSGYLLRKFKKTVGWQKLWVVFANFTLFFYKSWQDDAALVSLPLLGYSVGPPSEEDGINKEFVFKLQFKNHVYFFRADTQYTYERWTETLQTAIGS